MVRELAGFKFIVDKGFHSEAPVRLVEAPVRLVESTKEVEVSAPVIRSSNEEYNMPEFLIRRRKSTKSYTEVPNFIKNRKARGPRRRSSTNNKPNEMVVKATISRLSVEDSMYKIAQAFRRFSDGTRSTNTFKGVGK